MAEVRQRDAGGRPRNAVAREGSTLAKIERELLKFVLVPAAEKKHRQRANNDHDYDPGLLK